eukprot:2039956-Amphidinium_carterae.2
MVGCRRAVEERPFSRFDKDQPFLCKHRLGNKDVVDLLLGSARVMPSHWCVVLEEGISGYQVCFV